MVDTAVRGATSSGTPNPVGLCDENGYRTGTLSNPLHNYGADFYHDVSSGQVAGHSIVHKFGAGVMGTTLAPVTDSLVYRTPIVATALSITSTSAADNVAGAGAVEVTVTGIDANWNEVTQTVVPTGTTPSPITIPLLRVTRWYVSLSGSYANVEIGSHVGELSMVETVGGAVWSHIPIAPLPLGQSEIGVYTVPIGYVAYLLHKTVHVATTKTLDVVFFQRANADDVTPPYSGTMRVVEYEKGVSGTAININFTAPRGPFAGPCDLGFMAKVGVGTSSVSCEFELLLVQDGF
jgi:hypothetical protein